MLQSVTSNNWLLMPATLNELPNLGLAEQLAGSSFLLCLALTLGRSKLCNQVGTGRPLTVLRTAVGCGSPCQTGGVSG